MKRYGSEDELLEEGLAALYKANQNRKKVEQDAQEDQKRTGVYQNNKKVAEGIARIVKNTSVGNLGARESINGSAENQPNLPIVSSAALKIDPKKFCLSDGKSLNALIENLCQQQNINTQGVNLNNLEFIAAVIPLAGCHGIKDKACKGSTAAKYVPTFQNKKGRENHVIAFADTAGLEARLDHVKTYGDFNCVNEKGEGKNKNSALQAIEIPNAVAANLAENEADVFLEMQKQATVMVFIQYDVQEKAYSASKSYNIKNDYRGQDLGGMVEVKGGGISPYAAIVQGGATHNSRKGTIVEGEKRLTRVSVYVLAPMVMNSNGLIISDELCQDIVKIMQVRANQISDFYLDTVPEHGLSEMVSDLTLRDPKAQPEAPKKIQHAAPPQYQPGHANFFNLPRPPERNEGWNGINCRQPLELK